MLPTTEARAAYREVSTCQDSRLFNVFNFMDWMGEGGTFDLESDSKWFGPMDEKVPSLVVGKNKINVSEFANPSHTIDGIPDLYYSFVKFKCKKTGKYKITFSDLEIPDDMPHEAISDWVFQVKKSKKNSYGLKLVSYMDDSIYIQNYKSAYLNKINQLMEKEAEKDKKDDEYGLFLKLQYLDVKNATYRSKYVDKCSLKKGSTYYIVLRNPWKINLEEYDSDRSQPKAVYEAYPGQMSLNIKIEKYK